VKIKIIGSGCATCKKLHKTTEEVVKELGIDAKVEYSTDIQEAVELGMMQSPVLTIDGKPVTLTGHDAKSVKQAILGKCEKDNTCQGCNCEDGNC
jgi:small redox-active disulfide protein 2